MNEDKDIRLEDVRPTRKPGKLIAFCDLVVNGLRLKGCRLIRGANGHFFGLPSAKTKDGTYVDVVQVADKDLGKSLDAEASSAAAEIAARNPEAPDVDVSPAEPGGRLPF